MFEIGDYVLNATNGICKISEIVELDMSGDKQLKSYFLLRPVEEENDRVYIPVDNADKRIRKVITQDEALAVLDRVPEIEALAVNNEKERETRYKEAVRSCEPDSVISLLKCLHIRNEQRAQAGSDSRAQTVLSGASNHLKCACYPGGISDWRVHSYTYTDNRGTCPFNHWHLLRAPCKAQKAISFWRGSACRYRSS